MEQARRGDLVVARIDDGAAFGVGRGAPGGRDSPSYGARRSAVVPSRQRPGLWLENVSRLPPPASPDRRDASGTGGAAGPGRGVRAMRLALAMAVSSQPARHGRAGDTQPVLVAQRAVALADGGVAGAQPQDV